MATRPSGAVQRTAPAAPRFFELIPTNLNIDFVGLRLKALLLSWIVIMIGFGSIFLRGGLNYGIDFAGGTMVHVKFSAPTPIGEVRGALDEQELEGVSVQEVGQGKEFQVRVLGTDETQSDRISASIRGGLQQKFGEGSFEVLRSEAVGPKVGRDLWRDATLAVLAATLVMGIYIAVRFDPRFGIGAAIALIHDVLITLGALSIAGMEFDLTTVAGLLTVVGYSVNDTVVISDRIRENMAKMRRESLATIMNLSINETLSRTLITGGTSILVTLVLFLIGGSVVHSLAFTLLVGFLVGTYSSIFVASPIVLYLERRGAAKR